MVGFDTGGKVVLVTIIRMLCDDSRRVSSASRICALLRLSLIASTTMNSSDSGFVNFRSRLTSSSG